MHYSEIKVGMKVEVTGYVDKARIHRRVIKNYLSNVGVVIGKINLGDNPMVIVQFDGISVNFYPSEIYTAESNPHLFIKKSNGQWFYGHIIHTTEKNLLVDKCGGQNEEVLVCKDDFKIYLEVKL